LEIKLTLDRIPGGSSTFFAEDLKGIESSSDPKSISFEAVQFLTELQFQKKEQRAEVARQAALAIAAERDIAERARIEHERAVIRERARQKYRALWTRIADKTIASLTVSEADQRDACRQLGLW
jgi:hypothetical protein